MRRSNWWLLSVPLVALASASPASAQAADEEQVCILIGMHWSGTPEDVARISQVPVPASYASHFPRTGCSQLIVESLIDWHLAFGTEASATAALAFLERHIVGGKPPIADLPARLNAAGMAAGPDALSRAHRLQGSTAGRRLLELRRAHGDHLFFARQYLRTAALFGSLPLLTRAQAWAGPLADEAGAALDEEDADQVRALAMEVAVARARLSRDPADVSAARARVEAYGNPLYEVAAERAYSNGDDFCDFGVPEDDPETLACRDADNIERRVTSYLRQRAMLDILGKELEALKARSQVGSLLEGLPSFDRAVRLIGVNIHRRYEPRGIRRYAIPFDQLVELYLARADAYARLGTQVGAVGYRSREDGRDALGAAMDDLARAEALAPVSETPARFRQIATRFLDVHAKFVALSPQDEPQVDPAIQRKATYFRLLLANLDGIAAAR